MTASSLKPTKSTMRAQQFNPATRKLELNEIPIPSPGPDELLVKVLCASLCHSDLMIFEANDKIQVNKDAKPITLGHEGSGVVVEVGSNGHSDFQPGQEVGFLPAKNACFECRPCKTVHNLWCEKGTVQMQGFLYDGYFQEYVIVDRQNTMVLPPQIKADEAAPLFCAGVTAFNGINAIKLPKDSWVAVVGTGGLGHLGVQYAKAMGYKVIGLDITDAAVAVATAAGADHAFNSVKDSATYLDEIKKITGGGVAAAVNFTASKHAYLATPALVKPPGLIVAVGIPNDPVEFSLFDITMGRFELRGANNGTCYTMPDCINFSAEHGIRPHTEYFKLEEVGAMVEKMQQHKSSGRMAVRF
ncbi:propanol-preferring alcohol dehydrogenase [Microdochium nivale]|nr:propanol-preferring alcohol dehydrogenase [Microdochium nivale]